MLSISALVTVWLDPDAPSKYVSFTYTLLSGYVAYAILLVAYVWTQPRIPNRFRVTTHAVDITLFTLFMYLTEGVTSPFFAYFTFAIVCGVVRWQWRGALATASIAVAAFIGLGLYSEYVVEDPASRTDRFVLRASYLSVVAGFLTYLGAYQERIRQEVQRVADWPRTLGVDQGALVQGLARHAAQVLLVPRSVIVWLPDGAAVPTLTMWPPPDAGLLEPAAAGYLPLVGEGARDRPFICRDVARRRGVMFADGTVLGKADWFPLNAAFVKDFGVRSALALPLSGASGSGWLLCLDKAHLTSDEIEIGTIVAREIAATADQSSFVARLRDAAVQDTRTRLGRDLHDGLLQSLTAARLQMYQLARSIDETGATETGSRVRRIETAIEANQRELRQLVDQLRRAPVASTDSSDLAEALESLGHRLKAEWGLHVDARIDVADVPLHIRRELLPIVQEALANATRHGHATSAIVTVETCGRRMDVRVQDNGSGFPFAGRRRASELTELGCCPVSIRDRVTILGGTFDVESTDTGAILSIHVPLSQEASDADD